MTIAGEVRTEVRGGIGWVTLSRPSKRNALTLAMWTAIPPAMAELAARDDIAAVVLQGAEGTFGAGADLEEIVHATEGREEATDYCTRVVSALLAVATTRLPTLAFVSGVAAGGGAELALACDLRIADATASFAFPFARIGVVPDRFTLARLAATVGPAHARRLVLTGETVNAERALAIGLADEVTDLKEAATRWADTLQLGSRDVRIRMKRALAGAETPYDVQHLVIPMVESMVAGEVRTSAIRFLEKPKA